MKRYKFFKGSAIGEISEIKHLPPLKDGDMTRRQPDIAKMKQLLNRNLMSLEEGIKKVIANGNFF